jgi:hypothetical protein
MTFTTVGFPYFNDNVKKNCANRRAGEPGEKQEPPCARPDFWNLMQTRDKNRQKRDENEGVFPKNNHPRIEQLVKRNAPRAFRAPEPSAETDQPRAIRCSLYCALLHFESVYPVDRFRQFRTLPAHSLGTAMRRRIALQKHFVRNESKTSVR